MIAGLKPYPSMKDSGVPWLGDVPEHWEFTRLANLVHHRTKKFNTSEETPVLSLTINGVRVKKHLHVGKSAFSYIGHQLVSPGELVFTPRDFDQTPILSGVASTAGCISNLYFVVTSKPGVDIEFINRFLWGLKYQIDYFRQFSEGMRYSFSRGSFNNIPALYPPLPEQAAIVRFLDHADRRIRRYIVAKQKLIKLQEEQKQAIIHKAVTRGLNPNVRLKPSGVKWLGEVPEHWQTERAKWLFRKMDRPIQDDDDVVTCFRDGTVTLRKNRRVRGFTEALKEIGYQGIRRGDLVIHAMDAFAGAIGVADSNGKGTPVYSVCEPVSSANAHYYAYTVREMARSQWIQALAKGIRERSTDFRFDDFGTQLVPLPPLSEQTAIVRFLDEATEGFVATIKRTSYEIELLREYRTRLIADVVTGKLDVREAAAQLPDESEEPVSDTDLDSEGEEVPNDEIDSTTEETEV